MFNAKNARYIVMLFLILGTQTITFTADSIPVVPFHASDSPVEITQIQFITASNEYYLTINNNSELDIKEIVLKGIVFNEKDEVKGGFLRGKDIELKAKGSVAISYNFEEYTNVQDKRMLELLSNSIQDKNVIILIPYKVIFESSTDKANEKLKIWALNHKLLKNLKPGNVGSFQRIQGKIVQESEAWEPDAPCYFCEWCLEEAYSCGLSFISGNCRPNVCTQSWYCSCLYWQCSYQCKPVDQCC